MANPGWGRLLDLIFSRRYRPRMSRRFTILSLLLLTGLFFAFPSPAPLIFTPGEGWHYELPGTTTQWRKDQAKDQLAVAQEAFEAKDFSTTVKASSYLVRKWPLSDYAAEAQYLLGRGYEAQRKDERAFAAYQELFTKYPKSDRLADAARRQYQIASRFLAGQRFHIFWGYVPFFPNMEKTAGLFEKIVANGPYGAVAPHAQLRIGAAYESQKNYPEAASAYERAADRYHDLPIIAADALYRAGMSYYKQALTAEYDQSTAEQAIATFNDLMVLHPEDRRLPEVRRIIARLKEEQARGNFKIAEFYASQKRWSGALVYYNEVLINGAESRYASVARERIDLIKQRLPAATQ